jgi:AcrR family transcriptional regulator
MNSNNTKINILKVTKKQIQQYGIQEVSIRQITKELKLTTGAFYKHFDSKSMLFLELAQQLSNSLNIQINEYIQSINNPRMQLYNIGTYLIDFFIKEPNLTDLLFLNIDVSKDITKSIDDSSFPLFNLTMHTLNELIRQEQLIKEAKVLFIQCWSFIQGYALLIKYGQTVMNTSLVEQTLNDLIGGAKK